MIHLTLAGGLGNQMFEYAYARALSEEFQDLKIVINTYYNEFLKLYARMVNGCPEYMNYQLNLFELNPNVSLISATRGVPSGFVKLIPGALNKLGIYHSDTTQEKYNRLTYSGKFHMIDKASTYYKHADISRKKNISVLGWFQSEKYFVDIRNILLSEFQFKEPPSLTNQKMIEELSSCNSVCVHIRLGDYLNPHYTFSTVCPEKYYVQGMRYIAERIDNPMFYIFTNSHSDFEWIKQNYHFEFPVKYLDLGNPGHEDMRLMYYCKHFIISRSSFSWWGSYMSQNPDKIVIAPELPMKDCWLKDENLNDLYRDDMIIIPVDLEEHK